MLLGIIDVEVNISEEDLKNEVISEMSNTQYAVSDKDKFIFIFNKEPRFPKLVNIIPIN